MSGRHSALSPTSDSLCLDGHIGVRVLSHVGTCHTTSPWPPPSRPSWLRADPQFSPSRPKPTLPELTSDNPSPRTTPQRPAPAEVTVGAVTGVSSLHSLLGSVAPWSGRRKGRQPALTPPALSSAQASPGALPHDSLGKKPGVCVALKLYRRDSGLEQILFSQAFFFLFYVPVTQEEVSAEAGEGQSPGH